MDIFFPYCLKIAAASPKALKINLEQVCLYVPVGCVDKFIYCCLDNLTWIDLYEIHLFVESKINHRVKPLIQYVLRQNMAKTKIL